jgi:uncharacterized phiE125 gp8 family phage protein
MWNRLKLVAAPTAEALSLADAKSHVRADSSDDDTLITALIAAAQAFIEGPNGIGVALTTQTWRLSLDDLCAPVRIPLGPVQAVTGITYTDTNGATQTLDPSLYTVDTDQSPAVIARAWNATWPAYRCGPGFVKVTFTTGYGATAESVPADLIAAMKLIVGHLYANREAVGDVTQAALPLGVDAILNRYRVGQVA